MARKATPEEIAAMDADETREETPDFLEGIPEESQEIEFDDEGNPIGEVMRHKAYIDDDTLRDTDTWEKAIQVVAERIGPVIDGADVIGNGFTVLKREQKGILVGVPMMILEFQFNRSQFGNAAFVTMFVMVRNPDRSTSRYVVNDSGVGIRKQLATFVRRTGQFGGVALAHGFTASTYDQQYEDPEKPGEKLWRTATTYYLDDSR
jgi:hypothetical protein